MTSPLSPQRWHLGTGTKVAISLIVICGLIGALAYFGLLSRLQDLLKDAVVRIREMGAWSPVLYIALYAVACVALIPGAALTLAGGAAFGFFQGVIYVLTGATLGATAAFLVGRYFARDWVANRLNANPTFAAIDRATERDGWKIVFLTRLAPVFPFFLLNYAYSLTRVSLKQYLVATSLGIIPGTMLFTYIGSLASSAGHEATSSQWVWRAFVLATAILATAWLGKIARRALKERIPDGLPVSDAAKNR